MIKRIVRMTFLPEEAATFLTIFEASKYQIRGFNGCLHLELWRDKMDKNVFMTYSIWQSPEHLDSYRQSELFAETWRKTKVLFKEKAQAWSVDMIDQLH